MLKRTGSSKPGKDGSPQLASPHRTSSNKSIASKGDNDDNDGNDGINDVMNKLFISFKF